MLGLESSIITNNMAGTSMTYNTLWTYTSDFTSDVDDWVQYSVNGDNWTLAANQTIDSIDDWLKVTVADTQTSASGIGYNAGGNPLTSGFGVDPPGQSEITLSYKMHIVDGGSGWGSGESSTAQVTTSTKGSGPVTNVTLDTTTTVTSNYTVPFSSGNNSFIIQFQHPSLRPQAGAVFYVKDISVTVTETV